MNRDDRDWVRFPDLAGKVALVTGGSRGIGAATCRALAAKGALDAVNGREREAIDAVVHLGRVAGRRSVREIVVPWPRRGSAGPARALGSAGDAA